LFGKAIQVRPTLVQLLFSLLAILLPGMRIGYFSGALAKGVFLIADHLVEAAGIE